MRWQEDLRSKSEEEAGCFHSVAIRTRGSAIVESSLEGLNPLSLWAPMPSYSQEISMLSNKSSPCFSSLDVQVIKYDILTKSFLKWEEAHCWPAEPLFVPTPGAKDEDDGKPLGRGARPLHLARDLILTQRPHWGTVAPPTSHSWWSHTLKPRSV